jgi:hypothetical protein
VDPLAGHRVHLPGAQEEECHGTDGRGAGLRNKRIYNRGRFRVF